MRRFRRYIFNTLTVMSLLLILATVGLWVASSTSQAYIAYSFDSMDTQIILSGNGGGIFLTFEKWSYQIFMIKGWEIGHGESADPSTGMFTNLTTFSIAWKNSLNPMGNHEFSYLSFPHWFLALLFAILPTIWFIKWRKRRHLPDHPCSKCGYDLTGNQRGECPECGVSTMVA